MRNEAEISIQSRETSEGWIADVVHRNRVLFTSPAERTRREAEKSAQAAARIIAAFEFGGA